MWGVVLHSTLEPSWLARGVFVYEMDEGMVRPRDRQRAMTFISMSWVIHSPVTVPFIVRVHFTVMRDHVRYCDVKAWVAGPEFFQPASSVLMFFSYRHPLACSLAGLNRIRRVSRSAPCMLVVRVGRKGCRLPTWPSLQSEVFISRHYFPLSVFHVLASSSLFSCRLYWIRRGSRLELIHATWP